MNAWSGHYHRLVKYEWILFYLLVIMNLLPALLHPFFPAVDGPAHLYNANVIRHLLKGDSGLLGHFFTFNREIVPNWCGHALLVCLETVFSPIASAKILVALCLFLLPASFRYCVRRIHAPNLFASYLIFPFTYTFMFCMGFYNFYMGLIVLFFATGRLMAYRQGPAGLRALPGLFVLVLLAYFSHLFIFLSLGLIMFCMAAYDLLQTFYRKAGTRQAFTRALWLLAVSAVPLALSARYFYISKGAGEKSYLLKSELLQWLTSCRAVICYNMEDESMYTTYVFLVLLLLFSVALYLRISRLSASVRQAGMRQVLSLLCIEDIFLAITCLFVFLYFRMPDVASSAGYISMRLSLMVFLFLILWISSCSYPKWLAIPLTCVVLFSQYKLLKAHQGAFTYLNENIAEVMVIEKEIKPNTVIFPANYSSDWLSAHYSNYLGINKPVVVLENYECNNFYFPLSWNKGVMHHITYSNWGRPDEWLSHPEKLADTADYIFVQAKAAMPDSTRARVLASYRLSRETEHLLLFEKK